LRTFVEPTTAHVTAPPGMIPYSPENTLFMDRVAASGKRSESAAALAPAYLTAAAIYA